ncbi:metallophosphoesterase 1 isoform X3 [Temnothorax curvispinosus]|uniref:Metallophosphoesterase 1 isoform X3 n=1 Tax=Temnothorax curvispinosus TaxID=300111 RepID=A0A6J1QBS4_9HYME|nr:metallophosphoesterase 1 isoform X3 [Temnothorax curvispinosus]
MYLKTVKTLLPRTLFNMSLGLVFVLFFCEYLIYYVVLIQCEWPTLDPRKEDPALGGEATDRPVRAMFIADTHLLGSREGHWFDKLRREWQMYRAFQTMMTLHRPDVVFVLGDVFDEGQWCGSMEFEYYIKRFHSLFHVPKDTHIYVVAGNHDMGFHYAITPYRNQRFIHGLKSPSVRRLSLRDNHFVLINSMALEGDGCFLCRPTEIAVNKIAKDLKCARKIGNDCRNASAISRYSRPILLQVSLPTIIPLSDVSRIGRNVQRIGSGSSGVEGYQVPGAMGMLVEGSVGAAFRYIESATDRRRSHTSRLQKDTSGRRSGIHDPVFQLAQ